MGRLAAGVLWLCVLLLVVSGTLLSTAAGIPKFVVVGSEEPNTSGDTQLGSSAPYYSDSSSSRVDIGAFSSLYYDGSFTFYSAIDGSCDVNWEGFEDGFFRDSSSACTQFNAFRALLIVAIVFDFVLAFALYSCLLLGCWPRTGSSRLAVVGYVALAVCCLVPVAANVTSMALMIHLVFDSFAAAAEYGVSFRLMAAAFALCFIAVAVFGLHCLYYIWWVNRAKQVDGTTTEAVAMEVMKPAPAIAVTARQEDSQGSSIV